MGSAVHPFFQDSLLVQGRSAKLCLNDLASHLVSLDSVELRSHAMAFLSRQGRNVDLNALPLSHDDLVYLMLQLHCVAEPSFQSGDPPTCQTSDTLSSQNQHSDTIRVYDPFEHS